MTSYRRALIIVACFLACIYLFRSMSGTRSSKAKIITQSPSNVADGSRPTSKVHGATTRKPNNPTSAWKTTPKGRDSLQKHNGQQPIGAEGRLTLREQLAYSFPYDVQGKFPGYIWQTWKTTPASAEFQESLRAGEASWTEKHPGFVHEIITDQVAVHLIRYLFTSTPEVVEAYNALPRAILKADFFRYLILLARGGIYSDIDTGAIKSAAEWVPESVPRSTYGLVIGIEADPDRPDWKDWFARRIQFCQWTIQSKPGHPVLREIVATITEETLRKKKAGVLRKSKENPMEFTGPAVWTDKIFEYFNNPEYFDMKTSKGNITWENFTGMTVQKKVGDVIVLPITSFSPGVQQMGAGEDDDPLAFVKHNFEGSWKPESERHIGEEVKQS
ncbi:MAG: hypothetical protein M1825_001387 [Sarcosagium campestre]|nr:MAG: hypothetical protein M1825_001387 [Sarcosagium campestre]